MPGPGQVALPAEVPAPPRREVVALPVNRRPKIAFTGQQASPAGAFVLEPDIAERLFQRGASELAGVAHPLLTSGAMLDGFGVNRWVLDVGADEDPSMYPVVMDHLAKEALPVRE